MYIRTTILTLLVLTIGTIVASAQISDSISTSTSSSCPLITDYLKFGGPNDGSQVTKLQMFLKNFEKADIDISGNFDQNTENAVKNFQKKYMSEVLGPWDATRATGFVFITTKKKINQIVCANPMSLTTDEVAIIEAYKARGDSSESAWSKVGLVDKTDVKVSGDKDQTADNNVASVAGQSIMSRFWYFIKELFR